MQFIEKLKANISLLSHPQFYRNPISAISRRLLWQVYVSKQPSIVFETEYGFSMEAIPQDIGISSLFYRGRYEWAELQIWEHLLQDLTNQKSDLIILDIGANQGLYSLFTTAYLQKYTHEVIAKIYGFEPNPQEYQKFLKNIDLNQYKNIQALPLAVSDKPGKCYLEIPSENWGMLSHLLNENEVSEQTQQVISVEAINLDHWCETQGIQYIDLMKLDVEGHESKVLQGSQKLLINQKIRYLIMEVGNGQWQEAIQYLHQYNYQTDFIHPDGTLKPLAEVEVTGWSNILAQPRQC